MMPAAILIPSAHWPVAAASQSATIGIPCLTPAQRMVRQLSARSRNPSN